MGRGCSSFCMPRMLNWATPSPQSCSQYWDTEARIILLKIHVLVSREEQATKDHFLSTKTSWETREALLAKGKKPELEWTHSVITVLSSAIRMLSQCGIVVKSAGLWRTRCKYFLTIKLVEWLLASHSHRLSHLSVLLWRSRGNYLCHP